MRVVWSGDVQQPIKLRERRRLLGRDEDKGGRRGGWVRGETREREGRK